MFINAAKSPDVLNMERSIKSLLNLIPGANSQFKINHNGRLIEKQQKYNKQFHARQNYSHQAQYQSYNTTYQRQPQQQTHKHNQQVSNTYRHNQQASNTNRHNQQASNTNRHRISNVNRYQQNQKRTIPSNSINKQYTTNTLQDIRVSQQQQQSTTTQHIHNNPSQQGHTQNPYTLQSLQSQNVYGTPLMTHHTPKIQHTQPEQQQM